MSVTNLPGAADELLALSQAVTDLTAKLNRLAELDAILRHLVMLRHVPRTPTRLPLAPALEQQS